MTPNHTARSRAAPEKSERPRPRGRPVKGSEHQVKEDIVAAARSLFFEKGYEGTSTDEVSAKAGCSKRTLYARFVTKADLFEAVIKRFVEESNAVTQPYVLSGKTLEDRLVKMAEKMVEAFLSDDVRSFYFLIHREADRFPELVKIAEAAARKPSQQRIVELLEQGGISGDLDLNAERFSAIILWPLVRRSIAGETAISKSMLEDARSSVAFFLRGCGYTDT